MFKYMNAFKNEMHKVIDKKCEKYGLTGSQMRVLSIIIMKAKEGDVATPKMLEGILMISKPSVSSLLNKLESHNFIKRKLCKEDARERHI